jgi:FAD:protein FMN transferase
VSKRLIFLVFFLSLLSGTIWLVYPRHSLMEFSGIAMTMEYRILVGHPLSKRHQQRVVDLIDATFQEVDEIYNNWNPLSELSCLNRAEANTPLPLSPQLDLFLRRVDQWVDRTGGLFDPTVAPLQKLWRHYLTEGGCPTQGEIDALMPAIGWDKLRFGEGVLYKADSRVSLDLGGVAKGYCVDLILERLNQNGYRNLYVSWSGEIRTSGRHPDKRPWRVAIAQPSQERVAATIDLSNEAVATSGNYNQYWPTSGGCYTHICNPLTQRALEVEVGSVASATVLAPTCFLADLVATALMIPSSCSDAAQLASRLQASEPALQVWLLPVSDSMTYTR